MYRLPLRKPACPPPLPQLSVVLLATMPPPALGVSLNCGSAVDPGCTTMLGGLIVPRPFATAVTVISGGEPVNVTWTRQLAFAAIGPTLYVLPLVDVLLTQLGELVGSDLKEAVYPVTGAAVTVAVDA
jgi:hypothetical protein